MKTSLSRRLATASGIVLSIAGLLIWLCFQERPRPIVSLPTPVVEPTTPEAPPPVRGEGYTVQAETGLAFPEEKQTVPVQAPGAAAAPAIQVIPGQQISRPLADVRSGKGFDPRFVQPATLAGSFGATDVELKESADKLSATAAAEKAAAIAWAKANGWPISGETADGGSFEIMRMQGNRPIYNRTQNRQALISHNVAPLNGFVFPGIDPAPGGLVLQGAGWEAALFEEGPPRLTHQEFLNYDQQDNIIYAGRYRDGSVPRPTTNTESHATHVLGTILGRGVDPDNRSRGMAPEATARCFDWNDVDNEMRSEAGAATPGQVGKVYVSNHSYGPIAGWENISKVADAPSGSPGWNWFGENGANEDSLFGAYGSSAVNVDTTCQQVPYLLPFFAASNDRGAGPGFFAENVWWPQANGTWVKPDFVYGTSSAPGADGSQESGYDTMSSYATAKNVMAVGNMQDAVSSDTHSTSGVEMSSSSSFGPADDGRIKPDIVGNGDGVYSAENTSDSSYASKTGTSMATPGAVGTGLLLHQHYTGSTGQFMRASTLKALMIHTATDVFNAGPDYKSGWGLLDALAAVNHITLHRDDPGGHHIVEGTLSATAKEYRLSFSASPSAFVKATLCWTDPPGTAKAGLDNRAAVLVNDLDLVIRLPDGSIRRAPQLSYANVTAAATYSGNNIDTVEKIGGLGDLILGVPGTYELLVNYKGTLSGGDQAFSLILEGDSESGTIAEAIERTEGSLTTGNISNRTFIYQQLPAANGGDRAASQPIGHNEGAGFQTKISGATTVQFLWGVSSESGFDYLRFKVDGVEIAKISGEQATTTFTHQIFSSGEHTLSWEYTKDGSQIAGLDRGWVDKLEFNDLAEAVDHPARLFVPTVTSNVPWFLEPTPGNSSVPSGDVARAGDIGAGQVSGFQTDITGPAVVRFRMVQTGTTGIFGAAWTGGGSLTQPADNIWRTYSVELPAGPNTIQWTFYKPTAGSGIARVDQVEVFPMPSSLAAAIDLPSGSYAPETSDFATWISSSADGAPLDYGSRDATSARTIYAAGTAQAQLIQTVTGPGLVSFWWQADGDPNGKMSFSMRSSNSLAGLTSLPFLAANPALKTQRGILPIKGGTPWRREYVEIPPGFTDLSFVYTPGSNPGTGWLDQVVMKTDWDRQHPGRGLDRWSQRWETFGQGMWYATPDLTNGGVDSATHDDIGDSQHVCIGTLVTGPKQLYFDWKVSSEAAWDKFHFYIDNVEAVPAISGNQNWKTVRVDIPPGQHELRWDYIKDNSFSSGQDRAWLDRVILLRPDFRIKSVNRAGNLNVVNIRKDPTYGFYLDASTDLQTWNQVGGMIESELTDLALVVQATPGPNVYYRVRFEPETITRVENSGFELPSAAPNSFWGDAPGWGPPNDGPFTTSFENIPGFAAEGVQHLSIDAGAWAYTNGDYLLYPGVNSALVAVGARSGFTASNSMTAVTLNRSSNSASLGDVVIAAGFGPVSHGFWNGWPVTHEFHTDQSAAFLSWLSMSSGETRSFYDRVVIVHEAQ